MSDSVLETPDRTDEASPTSFGLDAFAAWVARVLMTNRTLPDEDRETLETHVSTLLAYLRLSSPDDLRSFDGGSILSAATRMAAGRASAARKDAKVALVDDPLYAQRLQVIASYLSRGGLLQANLALSEILSSLHGTDPSGSHLVSPLGSSPGSSRASGSDSTSIRTEIPTLPTFSGEPSSFKGWQDSTLTLLGKAGLDSYLTDGTLYADPANHTVARRIYFALRASVSGGTAAYLVADPNRSDTVPNPRTAWLKLIEKYNTALHQSNLMAFLLRDLFSLEINSSTSASTFLSKFSEYRAELMAQMGPDIPDLVYRAALLSGLRDSEYTAATLEILKSPDKGIDDLLTIVSTHETLLDNASGSLQRDLSTDTAVVRRAGTPQKKSVSFGDSQWRIPKFPDSWKRAFKGTYKFLLDWREAAVQGMSQSALDEKFTVRIKRIPASSDRSEEPEPSNANTETNPSSNKKQKKSKRPHKIRVVNGRRIITESS